MMNFMTVQSNIVSGILTRVAFTLISLTLISLTPAILLAKSDPVGAEEANTQSVHSVHVAVDAEMPVNFKQFKADLFAALGAEQLSLHVEKVKFGLTGFGDFRKEEEAEARVDQDQHRLTQIHVYGKCYALEDCHISIKALSGTEKAQFRFEFPNSENLKKDSAQVHEAFSKRLLVHVKSVLSSLEAGR